MPKIWTSSQKYILLIRAKVVTMKPKYGTFFFRKNEPSRASPQKTCTFQAETSSFYGMYYSHPKGSQYAIIAMTFEDKQLPYLPFPYRHPEHNQKQKEEAKRIHNMVATRELYGEVEHRCPITKDMRIKVEDTREHTHAFIPKERHEARLDVDKKVEPPLKVDT